jgi:predicted type IV restriction endonuclease
MNSKNNEAFSRVLIDKALEYSGWDLLSGKDVRFETHTTNGRADYLLKGKANLDTLFVSSKPSVRILIRTMLKSRRAVTRKT